MDRSRCVVLVPVGGGLGLGFSRGLAELERRGYVVWCVEGGAAVDQTRSRMATDALEAGFEGLFWLDSDIAFEADQVDALLDYDLPVVSGIYVKKGSRALALHVLPGEEKIVFGKEGGLLEIKYAGTGFLFTHRTVYETIAEKQNLPECNQRFGKVVTPYFLPLIVPDGDGHWYLGEDFAFCERARRSGYRIMADSSFRLGHIGSYEYSWEDAGADQPRYSTYHYHLE